MRDPHPHRDNSIRDTITALRDLAVDLKPVVKLTERGCARVLDARVGMTFVVNSFTAGVSGWVAHVVDHRYLNGAQPQVWSLARDDYEVI